MWAAESPPTPPSPAPTSSMATLSSICSSIPRLHDIRERIRSPGFPPATYRQNQFGGASAAASSKTSSSYFGDVQFNRQSQGASVVTSVPYGAEPRRQFQRLACVQLELSDLRPRHGRSGDRRGAHALSEQHDSRQPDPPASEERSWRISRCRIRSRSRARRSSTTMPSTARSPSTGTNGTRAKTTI